MKKLLNYQLFESKQQSLNYLKDHYGQKHFIIGYQTVLTKGAVFDDYLT